ncbi:hypothetical protein [Bradyrhizobium sp. CCGUVB14]|uniref:hypothetical protein n=1 Tax=Bradyrhizobium sp. CCGUVB14 TaxID=2949628 RepID=UPI0020B41F13|nr:hypothetical protein [Bradyrhizobium sp. CCGUVB14]MCP3445818.1 hypothetical protein [Bradyrhizobium sp. CCGUVB14]
MKVLAFVLIFLTMNAASASEFSVQCEGRSPVGPYFATFDTNSKAVVFETAPPIAGSMDGSNVLSGEIRKSDTRADGQVDFTLRIQGGELSLSYDGQRKRMTWPGINGSDPFRPTLTHVCIDMPPRSILSFRSNVAVLHPISVRCAEAGYMYFTMDPRSKRALFERDHGSVYQGEVTAAHGDDIDVLMKWDTPGQVAWNRSNQTITLEAIDGSGAKSPKTLKCEETAPRTMLEYYKRLR